MTRYAHGESVKRPKTPPPPTAFLNSLLLPLALGQSGYETGAPVTFASLFADNSPVVVFSVAECTRGPLGTSLTEQTIDRLRRSRARVVLLIKPSDPPTKETPRVYLSTRPENFLIRGNDRTDVTALLKRIGNGSVRAYVPTDDVICSLDVGAVRWKDRDPQREPPPPSAPRGLRNAVLWFSGPDGSQDIQATRHWLAPPNEPCAIPTPDALR